MAESNNKDKVNILIERIILLGYNLIDNSKRRILMSSILLKYNIKSNQIIKSEDDNKELVNNYFLLGLILGDGNLYVRIRESNCLP